MGSLKMTKSLLNIANQNIEYSLKKNSLFSLKIRNGNLLHGSFLPKVKNTTNHKRLISIFLTIKKQIEICFFGLCVGYVKQLDLIGVGYKSYLFGSNILVLKVDFSHEIKINVPKGIDLFCPKENLIVIKSFSKVRLGKFVSFVQSH